MHGLQTGRASSIDSWVQYRETICTSVTRTKLFYGHDHVCKIEKDCTDLMHDVPFTFLS